MNVSSLSVPKVEITTGSGVNETACSPAITFHLSQYCYPFVPAVPRPSPLFHLYFLSFPLFAIGGPLFERHSLYTQVHIFAIPLRSAERSNDVPGQHTASGFRTFHLQVRRHMSGQETNTLSLIGCATFVFPCCF